MKRLALVVGLISSFSLLSGCNVETTPYSPDGSVTTYGPEYNGYTVGYGYGVGEGFGGYSGYGNYVGYGGWASSYYGPGYSWTNAKRGSGVTR